MGEAVASLPERGQQIDFIATQVNLDFQERQKILGELSVRRRFEIVNTYLNREVEILELRQKIQSEAAGTIEDAQREFYLRQQMKAIQEELGEGEASREIDELREQIAKANLPDEAREEAERELGRMEGMPQASPEYSVSRTYLDWMVSVPWSVSSEDHLDVKAAERQLNKDHYGLERPKERILDICR